MLASRVHAFQVRAPRGGVGALSLWKHRAFRGLGFRVEGLGLRGCGGGGGGGGYFSGFWLIADGYG